MEKVYIASAKRSAIGAFGGILKNTAAADIAAGVIKSAMAEAGIDPDMVDYTVLGNVMQAAAGMGPGRQASMKAGIPDTKPGYTLNMLCSSGMKAVMTARASIMAGEADIIVSGGMENMSSAPFIIPSTARWGNKLGGFEVADHMISDGLTDVFNGYHMGITAENVAEKHDISRQAQDAFALESQKKAAAAIAAGKFDEEIVPIEVRQRRETVNFMKDEHPKSDTTEESLSKLRPAFKKDGTVTAGNASGINDGAAILILASGSAVAKLGLRPLAEITETAQAGIAPEIMGLGPVPAIAKLTRVSGLKLSSFGLIELNEAFAAQALGVIKELAAEHGETEEAILGRCNVNGGAIALGHPLGSSGARIIVTLLHEMRKQGVDYGLAALCAGGGMGSAVALKKV